MPKKPKQMLALLRKHGFEKVSQNGSHVKMYNKSTQKTVIVPIHSKELKKGLEKAIMRQAGFSEEEKDEKE